MIIGVFFDHDPGVVCEAYLSIDRVLVEEEPWDQSMVPRTTRYACLDPIAIIFWNPNIFIVHLGCT